MCPRVLIHWKSDGSSISSSVYDSRDSQTHFVGLEHLSLESTDHTYWNTNNIRLFRRRRRWLLRWCWRGAASHRQCFSGAKRKEVFENQLEYEVEEQQIESLLINCTTVCRDGESVYFLRINLCAQVVDTKFCEWVADFPLYNRNSWD